MPNLWIPRKLLLVRPTGKRKGREPHPPQVENHPPSEFTLELECAGLRVYDGGSTWWTAVIGRAEDPRSRALRFDRRNLVDTHREVALQDGREA